MLAPRVIDAVYHTVYLRDAVVIDLRASSGMRTSDGAS